jgi:hypothetical protein
MAPALAVLLLLAGCSTPAPADEAPTRTFLPFEAHDCDPNGLVGPSHNAPYQALFSTPRALAERMAHWMGEAITGSRPSSSGTVYELTNGSLGVTRDELGRAAQVSLNLQRVWPSANGTQSNATFRSLPQALQLPIDVDAQETSLNSSSFQASTVTLRQIHPQGTARIHVATLQVLASSNMTLATLRAINDLTNANATLGLAETRALAQLFVRCQMDTEGKTAAKGYAQRQSTDSGWDVIHESLGYIHAFTFDSPGGGHCPGLTRMVTVDAVTGAILASSQAPCF